jgi:DNA-binding NarL/FixJ family response regulator
MALLTDASLRLLIAHPLSLLRQGLRLRVAEEQDIAVVGECGSPGKAIELARVTEPDVAVVGLGDDWRRWLDASSAIAAGGSKVLIVEEQQNASIGALAVKAGATGFISMNSSGLTTAVTAVRTVAGGEAWVPRSMVSPLLRALIEDGRDDDAATSRFSRLSSRERQVLALLVEGLDSPRIASRLFVSPHTARTHIQRIREKLEVHSRLEAVAFALDHRLIERFGQAV